jgi:glutathione S-transferase
MIKLFYVTRTRANRPRWLLEEMGVPYELVRLDPSKGETKTPEHTRRHPLQHVPVLETEQGTLYESAAVVLQLADLYPDKKLLAPVGTHERGLAYQWAFYGMTELEPHAIALFREKVQKKVVDSPAVKESVEKVQGAIRPLEAVLERQPFLTGQAFSVADVVVGSILSWVRRMGAFPTDVPSVARYLEALEVRPAFVKANAD